MASNTDDPLSISMRVLQLKITDKQRDNAGPSGYQISIEKLYIVMSYIYCLSQPELLFKRKTDWKT